MSTTRISIDEYDRMIEAGLFSSPEDRRLELIEGELREMPPIGPPHEDVVDLLTDWRTRNAKKNDIRVRVQNSIGLPDQSSVPQPDIAWVRDQDYSRRRPQAQDVLLLIEVADSSLNDDLREKRDLYAQAGIQDYWVVDVNGFCVHIFRDPQSGVYQNQFVCELHDRVCPIAVPTKKLEVAELFRGAA